MMGPPPCIFCLEFLETLLQLKLDSNLSLWTETFHMIFMNSTVIFSVIWNHTPIDYIVIDEN